MHVAATLALEDEGMSYTMPNVAWMFDRIRPEEVRDILLLRRNHPDDYKSLPMAGATESLSSAEIEAAASLRRSLPPNSWMHSSSPTARAALSAAIFRNPSRSGRIAPQRIG